MCDRLSLARSARASYLTLATPSRCRGDRDTPRVDEPRAKEVLLTLLSRLCKECAACGHSSTALVGGDHTAAGRCVSTKSHAVILFRSLLQAPTRRELGVGAIAEARAQENDDFATSVLPGRRSRLCLAAVWAAGGFCGPTRVLCSRGFWRLARPD